MTHSLHRVVSSGEIFPERSEPRKRSQEGCASPSWRRFHRNRPTKTGTCLRGDGASPSCVYGCHRALREPTISTLLHGHHFPRRRGRRRHKSPNTQM